jgi:Ran GTPase-activating protein (RanGAP) involved in mRNA processing and transport
VDWDVEMQQHDAVGGKKKTSSDVAPPTRSVPVSLRANNNKITDLDDMKEALHAIFDDLSKLQWLDLSGNAISSIPPTAFADYPELFTLHLHGNGLSKYADVDNLARHLPNLHALTLHGNPLDEKKHFRNYVIAAFPKLAQLNFSCVTRGDRERAETWANIYKKARRGVGGKGGVDDDL